MYRQFHRILEAFKITEIKEDAIKEESGKDAPKTSSSKPQEKVQDQFAADEEAVEVSWSYFTNDELIKEKIIL